LPLQTRVVDTINDAASNKLGPSRPFFSLDRVESEGHTDVSVNYPVEFLNKLTDNGYPPHEVTLSIGSVVVLLTNLNKAHGLCNGPRLIIDRMDDHL
jgi:hypothetical protein